MGETSTPAMRLSLPRLYAMRLGYLVLGGGLAVIKWPLLFGHAPWTLMQGVVNCMLIALSVLALLGIRYPVQMLPVLLFESAWKVIWLAAVALPLVSSGRLDAATRELGYECLGVVLILAVIPWRYVARQYLARPGDRWRAAPAG